MKKTINREIQKRILWTLLFVLVFRYGCILTVPGIDQNSIRSFGSSSFMSIVNMLGGGALQRFSIFALGVNPYITASIIIELMSVVIPVLEEWKHDGIKGTQKTERTTRYLSLALAVIQAFSITYGFDKQYGILIEKSTASYLYIIVILTAGSMVVVWLGDQITKHGIGNGLSIIIFAGIVSELPSNIINTYSTLAGGLKGQERFSGILDFILYILFYLAIIFFVLRIETAERRIQIQNARGAGFGSNKSYLPIKVNPSGVIPVIFAQSIMTVPLTIISFLNKDMYTKLNSILSLDSGIGIILYAALICLFTFFYSNMVIDTEDIDESFKRSGTFIPGIRPGKDTQRYLSNILNSTCVIGSTALTLIAVLPYIISKYTKLTTAAALGGTGIIVAVSVAVETMDYIKTKNTEKKYKKVLY